MLSLPSINGVFVLAALISLSLLESIYAMPGLNILGSDNVDDILARGRKDPPGPGQWPPTVCNANERGPHLQVRQQAALADWVVLFYHNKDVLGSFNRWIPGQWINHNPGAGQGRDDAIGRLTALFASEPTVTMTPQTAFAGQGFAFVHFKFDFPGSGITFSAWHGFRFQGLCFVEHWDGVQRVFGNETNPIAFF